MNRRFGTPSYLVNGGRFRNVGEKAKVRKNIKTFNTVKEKKEPHNEVKEPPQNVIEEPPQNVIEEPPPQPSKEIENNIECEDEVKINIFEKKEEVMYYKLSLPLYEEIRAMDSSEVYDILMNNDERFYIPILYMYFKKHNITRYDKIPEKYHQKYEEIMNSSFLPQEEKKEGLRIVLNVI